MTEIYSKIAYAKKVNKKLLAILLDPDKIVWETLENLIFKINQSPATHVFIGGSQVYSDNITKLITEVKRRCLLPVILFPGNPSQISAEADGILFLSLISGRNPDYLIDLHVKAAPILKTTNLEVIPTGYILVESGKVTAVEKVSGTKPLGRSNGKKILATAQAGEFLGMKLIYLEAGSGAEVSISKEIVKLVSKNIDVPLIVGGGLKTREGIDNAYNSGADMVVIGTAFENDHDFFDKIIQNLEFESEK